MWDRIKQFVPKDISLYTALFVIAWLGGWLANGLLATHLDLAALQNFFWTVLAKFGIDSLFNSKLGEQPGGSNNAESKPVEHSDDG